VVRLDSGLHLPVNTLSGLHTSSCCYVPSVRVWDGGRNPICRMQSVLDFTRPLVCVYVSALLPAAGSGESHGAGPLGRDLQIVPPQSGVTQEQE
jgi:hypothetical protein